MKLTGLKIISIFTLFIFIVSGCGSSSGNENWQHPFNGEDFTGWHQQGGEAKYKVEGNTIVGTSVHNTPNSFMCTQQTYDDFILEFEVKCDPALNSGVQFRSESRPEDDYQEVYGYQVEIASNGNAGRIWDEKRRTKWLDNIGDGPLPAEGVYKPGEWNQYRVKAKGDSIKTWINGEPIIRTADDMTDSGFIGLQVHSVGDDAETMEVRWRNIRIQPL